MIWHNCVMEQYMSWLAACPPAINASTNRHQLSLSSLFVLDSPVVIWMDFLVNGLILMIDHKPVDLSLACV